MHAVRAVVLLLATMQMRAPGEAVRAHQRPTASAPQREPLPSAVIVWICIQEGASGIPARGTMVWDIGNTGCMICVHVVSYASMSVCAWSATTPYTLDVCDNNSRGAWLWHAAGLWTFPSFVVVVSAW